MKNLLVIQSSGRVTRSVTRQLVAHFVEKWKARHADGRVVVRDLTANPPPVVTEEWVAAAFGDPALFPATPVLRASEEFIAEIEAADAIVIGAPIYNFGVPAQLKAWIDQIVRVGRTFAFAPGSNPPYVALLRSKPVLVVVAAGNAGLFPGQPLGHFNLLEPQLVNALGFIGLTNVEFVRASLPEGDESARQALAEAEAAIEAQVARR